MKILKFVSSVAIVNWSSLKLVVFIFLIMIFFVVVLYFLLQYQLNVWVLTTLNLVLHSKREKRVLVLQFNVRFS